MPVFVALDVIRPTAQPALLFLLWIPVFSLLPAHRAIPFFIVTGLVTLMLVAGPAWAVGMAVAIVLSHTLVEAVARMGRGRRPAFIALIATLHVAYWACFHLPLPSAFRTASIRPEDQPGVFVLFSGIGLTFFRLVSYAVDRCRDRAGALRLAEFLAFMLYYPQFRHGPIERAHPFTAQLLRARDVWTPRDVIAGLGRIVAGMVAALAAVGLAVAVGGALFDGAGGSASAVLHGLRAGLDDPGQLSLTRILLLIHLPALLLYAAESAFASVQLGVSRAFGIRGTENFRWPFLAADPRSLWHRWNITLSAWLRDYAYIPLGGNRRRKALNIVLVFVYAGLLHGLQPRCLVWGLWTGLTVALYARVADVMGRRWTDPLRGRPVRHVVRFLARLATFHWFSIGVTIIVDPQTCGLRVLHRYLHLVTGGLVP